MSIVDAHQRKTIEKSKKMELEKAQNELLGDLEEVNALDRKLADISQGAGQRSTKYDGQIPSTNYEGPSK